MASLQILELPEGSSDDRPPFVLVVDQMPANDAAFEALRCDLGFATAEQIGARAVLVFEETIDIPANDPPPGLDETFKTEVQNWAAGTNETLARIIHTIGGKKGPKSRQTQTALNEEQAKRLWDLTRDA